MFCLLKPSSGIYKDSAQPPASPPTGSEVLVHTGTGEPAACKYLKHQGKTEVLSQDYNMEKYAKKHFSKSCNKKWF